MRIAAFFAVVAVIACSPFAGESDNDGAPSKTQPDGGSDSSSSSSRDGEVTVPSTDGAADGPVTTERPCAASLLTASASFEKDPTAEGWTEQKKSNSDIVLTDAPIALGRPVASMYGRFTSTFTGGSQADGATIRLANRIEAHAAWARIEWDAVIFSLNALSAAGCTLGLEDETFNERGRYYLSSPTKQTQTGIYLNLDSWWLPVGDPKYTQRSPALAVIAPGVWQHTVLDFTPNDAASTVTMQASVSGVVAGSLVDLSWQPKIAAFTVTCGALYTAPDNGGTAKIDIALDNVKLTVCPLP